MYDLKGTQSDSKLKFLNPPEKVFKMKSWQPELFTKQITVAYLTFPEDKINHVQKKFKETFLKIPNFKPIQKIDSPGKKRILLDPEKIISFEDIPLDDRNNLKSLYNVDENDFGHVNLDLSVDNFRPSSMLKAVLPSDEVEGLSSYSHIGHIIHVNLKEELYPYKKVIGEILLRLPNVRLVVNKSSTIDNTFRNFEMEVLARAETVDPSHGDDFIVSVKENGTKFMFDFSKVYWNPRLSNEHQRIVELLNPGDTLCDVFAGVGPFSITAALRGKTTKKSPSCIRVLANDLNPNSFDWLVHNFDLNKVPKDQYSCFNKDGKDFILQEVKNELIKFYKSDPSTSSTIHITMNLPATAVEFLHHFRGLLADVSTEEFVGAEKKNAPIVHVYTFTKADDKESDVRERCQEQLSVQEIENLKISFVRNVAPRKDMMRATFPLAFSILTTSKKAVSNEEPNSKRLRLAQ